MRSVRARIAITAVVVTAIAFALAAVFLLQGLRTSLSDQIDESVTDQAFDASGNVADIDSLAVASFLFDPETLQVIFDDEGFVYLTNDGAVDVAELLAELPFRDSDLVLDPIVVDAAIESAQETPGSEQMRAAVTPIVLLDEIEGEAPLYVVVARSTGSVDDAVASTRNRLLLVFPALTLLVGLLAWWLAGRALRPVDRMRAEVDEISAGDLSRRVSEPSAEDEVGQLATTMNGMLARLEGSATRQRQFVSDAAHELRTPLASIAAQLDVDAAHPDTADRPATAHSVRGEVSRMQHMIDSLLQLARSDQGRLLETSRLLDFDEIARMSATRVPKSVDTTLHLERVAPTEVRGDQNALLRVVDNLLANAYRHAASRVDIAVGADDDGVWLTLDDDGSGVPAEHREQIFERFVRLDEARTRDSGGSGLGLALSREIAHQHGGNLFVVDSPLGGAQFVLRLPVS